MQLTRIYLSFAIAFSALVGYILCYKHITLNAILVFLGVFFLSSAASVFNQYQERHLDAQMDRTKDRPIPSKKISSKQAITIANILLIIGLGILLQIDIEVTLLGLFNLIWYIFVYTPLKLKTSYAVLLGALTGVIPPIMGWIAAKGSIFDPEIIFISAFMFLWQIPHFWLLLLKYKKDYDSAGFKTIISKLSQYNSNIILFSWIVATSICSLFFPLFHIISSTSLISLLLLFNVSLILFFYKSLFNKEFEPYKKSLMVFNIYQLLVFGILLINAF